MGYGAFGDLAVHLLDFSAWLSGEALTVTRTVGWTAIRAGHWIMAARPCSHTGALPIHLRASATLRGPRLAIRLDGSEGSLELSRGGWSCTTPRPSPGAGRRGGPRRTPGRPGGVRSLLGQPRPELASLAEALAANRLLDDLYGALKADSNAPGPPKGRTVGADSDIHSAQLADTHLAKGRLHGLFNNLRWRRNSPWPLVLCTAITRASVRLPERHPHSVNAQLDNVLNESALHHPAQRCQEQRHRPQPRSSSACCPWPMARPPKATTDRHRLHVTISRCRETLCSLSHHARGRPMKSRPAMPSSVDWKSYIAGTDAILARLAAKDVAGAAKLLNEQCSPPIARPWPRSRS